VSGEIAEDIASYFAVSEQQPSAVSLGVSLSKDAKVNFAGGFIVQILPETSEETLAQLESNLTGLPSLTQFFEEGLDMIQVANQVFAGLGLDELEEYELNYRCDCSRDKMETALMSLGMKELMDIVNEDGQAELVCHFCNTSYHFDKSELMVLIQDLARPLS
jgi:molecular chaperone Hsp33